MWSNIKNDLKALSISNCSTEVYDLTVDEAELLRPEEQAVGLQLLCTKPGLQNTVEHKFWILDNGRIEVASMRAHLKGSNGSETLRQKIQKLKKDPFFDKNAIADQNDLDAWTGIEMPLYQTELIDFTDADFVSDPKGHLDCAIFETVAQWYTTWYLGSSRHSLQAS